MSEAVAQRPARILVTGSNDGIGAAIADALVTRGMDVVRHARNARRAEQCRDRAGGPIEIVVGDYASLESTTALADGSSRWGPLTSSCITPAGHPGAWNDRSPWTA